MNKLQKLLARAAFGTISYNPIENKSQNQEVKTEIRLSSQTEIPEQQKVEAFYHLLRGMDRSIDRLKKENPEKLIEVANQVIDSDFNFSDSNIKRLNFESLDNFIDRNHTFYDIYYLSPLFLDIESSGQNDDFITQFGLSDSSNTKKQEINYLPTLKMLAKTIMIGEEGSEGDRGKEEKERQTNKDNDFVFDLLCDLDNPFFVRYFEGQIKYTFVRMGNVVYYNNPDFRDEQFYNPNTNEYTINIEKCLGGQVYDDFYKLQPRLEMEFEFGDFTKFDDGLPIFLSNPYYEKIELYDIKYQFCYTNIKNPKTLYIHYKTKIKQK
jgi:hypothetical protein